MRWGLNVAFWLLFIGLVFAGGCACFAGVANMIFAGTSGTEWLVLRGLAIFGASLILTVILLLLLAWTCGRGC